MYTVYEICPDTWLQCDVFLVVVMVYSLNHILILLMTTKYSFYLKYLFNITFIFDIYSTAKHSSYGKRTYLHKNLAQHSKAWHKLYINLTTQVILLLSAQKNSAQVRVHLLLGTLVIAGRTFKYFNITNKPYVKLLYPG